MSALSSFTDMESTSIFDRCGVGAPQELIVYLATVGAAAFCCTTRELLAQRSGCVLSVGVARAAESARMPTNGARKAIFDGPRLC